MSFNKSKLDHAALQQASLALHAFKQSEAEAQRQRAKVEYDKYLELQAEKDRQEEAEKRRRREETARLEAKIAEDERLREELNFTGDSGTLHNILSRFAAADSDYKKRITDNYHTAMERHLEWPTTIDFARLPKDGKIIFLPAYLDLLVGKDYPRYHFYQSNPEKGRYVYVCRYGPADARMWREHLPKISRYLGGNWAVQEIDGSCVELRALPTLPAVLPFEMTYLRKGEVFCGINVETAGPLHIPLAKMTHTLVCGQTGSGKSVGLNQLKRSLLYNLDSIAEIAACDLKGGVDLARFAGLSPKIDFIDSYAGMHDLAERWVGIMKSRFAEMRANGEVNTTGNYRILIVDEFSEIGGYEPPKEEKAKHLKLLANLALLAQQGRAAGIRLILQTQAPTADYLPTTIMKNLASVMCYRMNSRQNVAALFTGHGDNLPADPVGFATGEYLFANGATGELKHLRTTACHEHNIDALKACLPNAKTV